MANDSKQESYPSVMIINWLKRNESPKTASEHIGSEKVEVGAEGQDPKKSLWVSM